MGARLIQVIETDFLVRGDGTEDHEYRLITQYWSPEGDLLAERDPAVPLYQPVPLSRVRASIKPDQP